MMQSAQALPLSDSLVHAITRLDAEDAALVPVLAGAEPLRAYAGLH